MSKIDIVFGDWSDDGHGKYKRVTVSINITKEKMQDAYLSSCKKFGFNLDDACRDYEDSTMPDELYNILVKENYPDVERFDEDEYSKTMDTEMFLEILMWWIKQSYPEFKWKKTKGIPTFNGYWDKKLNLSFGYGLFS
jgi:hypothetical protein